MISINKHFQYLLLTIFIAISNGMFSQYYIVGQDPASIKWKQINSEYFRIIYPDGYKQKAEEYINLLETSRSAISNPYLDKNKKVQIVLHNRTVTSNAIVSPTPMHADFFEMPGQDTYAQSWSKQLTLHEYRHVVQMQKLNQGLTRVLKIIFGDQAIGGIMGVFLPFWFIEGDAVFSETYYSSSGRGRSPDFTMDLKAQILDKKIYAYDKALYGSYKDYTPDHYTLGYELVTYGTKHFGEQMWSSMLSKVARKPYTLVPFSSSLKKTTGTGKVGYYKKSLQKRKEEWISEDSSKLHIEYITPEKVKHFTNYRFINEVSDGSFIVEKSGIDDISRFVKVFPDGREEKLFTPGYNFGESLSANDSILCWNEKTYDPRWANRSYSVIKIYNFKTKKLKQLTRKSRLFAPALSNKSNKIVAVKVTEENEYFLTIIDAVTGSTLHEFKTGENLFFTHPRWSDTDEYIVSVVVGEKGKSIILVNTTNWNYKFIVPFDYSDIQRPTMSGNTVIYTGVFNGTSNIFSLDISSGNTTIHTNVRFGAIDGILSGDGDKIYFSNYTADGYRIANISSSNALNNLTSYNGEFLVDQIVPESNFNLDDTNILSSEHNEKKYSKLGHLFNLHSWGLAAVDLNNYDFQPGINLLTQNILSTSYGSIGYYYDPNENAGKTKLDFTYAGWYPEINISADYGMRRHNYADSNNVAHQMRWMETNLSAGLSIPLRFTHNIWAMGLTPYADINQKFMDVITTETFKEDQVTSLAYGIMAYTQYKRSAKDIFPRWGFYTNIFFKHTPFSESPSMIYGWAETFFFPGIIRHHGIRIYSAYQVNELGNYNYSNMVSTPRGYTGIYLNNLTSLKSEYALPLIYPDINIPSILYLKRITMHLYFDYAQGDNYSGPGSQYYSSTGVELYSDWHFLSLIPNIRLGVRTNYRLNDNTVNFEFLYGFSIY